MSAKVATLRAEPRGGLLTPEEAADYLKISKGTLKNWVTLRRIEFVKIGNRTRFTRAALDRYIAEQTIAPIPR